jgi:hypothetical protein
MANEKEKTKKEKHDQEDGDIKSDPETLNTTDPQEHMEGPISSLMKEVGESFDDEDTEKKSGGK